MVWITIALAFCGWFWWYLDGRFGREVANEKALEYLAGYLIEKSLAVDNVFAAKWREGEYNFASWWDRSERPSRIPAIHFVAGPPTMARLSATFFW